MQAWLVYRVETALSQPSRPLVEAKPKTGMPVSVNALNASDPAVFITQIDARLSALENRDIATSNPVGSSEPAPIALDGAAALAADRKLQAMLPKEPLTHEELIIFQAQLGQLPEVERHQLLAALSRAINTGRVRQKFN